MNPASLEQMPAPMCSPATIGFASCQTEMQQRRNGHTHDQHQCPTGPFRCLSCHSFRSMYQTLDDTLFCCAAQSQSQPPLMAERCPNCFQDAMDKLWFQKNILSHEPPSLSLQSLAKRMKPKAVICSCGPPPPECSTSVRTEKSSAKEDQENKRPTRLNIDIRKPLFQLQPPPGQKTQSRPSPRRERKAKNARRYRSLSELENYELKGFLDLGFTFPKEKLSPKLLSMVPGLHRVAEEGGPGEEMRSGNEELIQRPYLSEAWPLGCRSSPQLDLQKMCRSPPGADMKKNLRFWARKVASLVHHGS